MNEILKKEIEDITQIQSSIKELQHYLHFIKDKYKEALTYKSKKEKLSLINFAKTINPTKKYIPTKIDVTDFETV